MKKMRIQQIGESWEIVKCPPEIYDELDRRGFIPPFGIVSAPGNTWISPGKEEEVIEYLRAIGCELETDLPDQRSEHEILEGARKARSEVGNAWSEVLGSSTPGLQKTSPGAPKGFFRRVFQFFSLKRGRD